MKLLSQSAATNQTRNFVYFAANYPSNFIHQCWADETETLTHIRFRFIQYNEANAGPTAAFFKWFFSLSERHQSKLINWVNVHYKG